MKAIIALVLLFLVVALATKIPPEEFGSNPRDDDSE